MTTSAVVEHPVRSSARRPLLLAGAAVLWAVAYRMNLRWWDWVVYDVVGLDPDTRFGSAVHFFLYDITKIALLLTGRDLRRHHRPQLHVGRANPGAAGRTPRGHRQRRGRRDGNRHAVLLVLGRAGVHRLRRRWRSARCDA